MTKSIVLTVSGILVGIASAASMDRGMGAMERGSLEYCQAKREMMGSAALFELHNRIYAEVGAHAWEARVKPEFMRKVTYATIRETGKAIPELQDVVKWVQAHPADARRMLEAAGASGR